ncbi:hypothetical protein [Desulfurobacterium sp.]
MKVQLKIKHEIEMTPVYLEDYEKLFNRFLMVAEKEMNAFNMNKLSNKVFCAFFKKKKRWLLDLKKRLSKRKKSVKEKKIIYDLFHSIFRNHRWACKAGSEREIEIKVWIASSIDKMEMTLKIMEKNIERD